MTLPPFPPRIDSITAEVRRIMAECLGLSPGALSGATGTDTLADFLAHSIDVVEIAMALEREFDIDVSDDEISTRSTVADIATLVSSKLGTPVPA